MLDDLVGLTHFCHAHQIAVVAVTRLAHWNVEVQLVIDFVGLRLAHIPGQTGATQHGASQSQIDSTLRSHHADTDVTLLPDTVIGQQGFVFVGALGEALCEGFDEVQQRALAVFVHGLHGALIAHLAGLVLRHAVGQIAIDTAWTEVSRVHTCTRHCFVHVHQRFALTEGVDQDGGAARVVARRTQPHQVIHDAGDFGEHHTDVLRANRHFDAHQLFDGQAVGVLVAHHRAVIQAVHIGQRLDVGLAFGQLFSGAVQQADVWVSALHHFTVELQHQTQHTVRGRVLRTKVQGIVFDFSHGLPSKALARLSAGLRHSFLHE